MLRFSNSSNQAQNMSNVQFMKHFLHYEISQHCLKVFLSFAITLSLSLSVWLYPWPRSTPVWEIEQSKLSEEPLPVVYLRSLSCDSVSWGGCMRPVWGGNMVALLILLMWTQAPATPSHHPPWLCKVSTQPVWRQSPRALRDSCTTTTHAYTYMLVLQTHNGPYTW